MAPIITTILFLTVFSVAFGTDRRGRAPYVQFLGPGLIMMTILQNAFANTSTSDPAEAKRKYHRRPDAPLSPLELTLGYVLGGATRGLLLPFVLGCPFG